MRTAILALGLLLATPSGGAWGQLRGEADRSASLDPPDGLVDVVWGTNMFTPEGDAAPSDGPGGSLAGDPESRALGRLSPYAVSTPLGLTALRVDPTTGTCTLHAAEIPDDQAKRPLFALTPLDGCQHGRLLGYWAGPDAGSGKPGEGLLLVCRAGPFDAAILSAYTLDGALAWAKRPREEFPDATDNAAGLDSGDVRGSRDWSCDGAAIEADAAVVPFVAVQQGREARHRVARFLLPEGEVDWAVEVQPGGTSANEAAGNLPGGTPQTASPPFIPLAVTTASTGYVVAGLMPCAHVALPELPALPLVPEAPTPCRSPTEGYGGYTGAIAWLDRDGNTNGVEAPLPRTQAGVEDDPVRFVPPASSYAAASGALVAAQVGGRILVVDPSTSLLQASLPAPAADSGDGLGSWPGPLWQDQRLVVPTDRRVGFLDPATFSELGYDWSSPDANARIVDLAGDRLGRLYVLTITVGGNTTGLTHATQGAVTILERDGNRVVHRLPLNDLRTLRETDSIYDAAIANAGDIVSQQTWMQPPRFLEHDGHLAVADAAGGLFLLAPRDRPLRHTVSDAYPDKEEVVRLRITAPHDPASYQVRWGDGPDAASWTWPPGARSVTVEHAYPNDGRMELIATVVHANARNGTTSVALTIDVAGDRPPQDLVSWVLARENQDMVWGFGGLIAAILGTAWGFWKLRRSRNRIDRAMRQLQDIRARARSQPLEALKDLQELRKSVTDQAVAGRLDQSQLLLIESRAASTARTLLFGLVAPFRDRLTPVYQGMLGGFFEDGRMGAHESEAALEGLDKQRRLTAAERDTLAQAFGLLQP